MTVRMKLELRPSLLNKMCSTQMSAFLSFCVLRILIEGYVYSTSCHSFSMLMIICWLRTNVEGYNFANSSFFLLLFIYFFNFGWIWIDGLLYCHTSHWVRWPQPVLSWGKLKSLCIQSISESCRTRCRVRSTERVPLSKKTHSEGVERNGGLLSHFVIDYLKWPMFNIRTGLLWQWVTDKSMCLAVL